MCSVARFSVLISHQLKTREPITGKPRSRLAEELLRFFDEGFAHRVGWIATGIGVLLELLLLVCRELGGHFHLHANQ